MKTKKWIALTLTIVLVTAACKKNEMDNTKPIAIIATPHNEQKYFVGCDTCIICFAAQLSDNEMLKEYKIEVHSAAGHGSHASSLKALNASWRYDTIVSLEGKRNTTIDLDIPLKQVSDTGLFHFILYVTDKSGNEILEEKDIRFILK